MASPLAVVELNRANFVSSLIFRIAWAVIFAPRETLAPSWTRARSEVLSLASGNRIAGSGRYSTWSAKYTAAEKGEQLKWHGLLARGSWAGCPCHLILALSLTFLSVYLLLRNCTTVALSSFSSQIPTN